jgi:hypothetical protein
MLHRAMHEWFVAQSAPADLEALNEKVYAELFLTPSSDPWLGLSPQNTYTGLEKNGVVEPQPAAAAAPRAPVAAAGAAPQPSSNVPREE